MKLDADSRTPLVNTMQTGRPERSRGIPSHQFVVSPRDSSTPLRSAQNDSVIDALASSVIPNRAAERPRACNPRFPL